MLFRWLSARLPRVDFWLPAANLARALVAVEDQGDFLSQYGALLKLLVRYVGRQALTMSLPLLVVATIAMAVLPQSAAHSTSRPGESDPPAPRQAARANDGVRTAVRTDEDLSGARAAIDEKNAEAGALGSEPSVEQIVPVAAHREEPPTRDQSRPGAGVNSPTAAHTGLSLCGLGVTDLTFFSSVCVGYGLALVVPRRKR